MRKLLIFLFFVCTISISALGQVETPTNEVPKLNVADSIPVAIEVAAVCELVLLDRWVLLYP